MGKKKAVPIKLRYSVSKRALPDKKSAKVTSPKRGKPSDRWKFKSSAIKFITEAKKPASGFPVVGIGASAPSRILPGESKPKRMDSKEKEGTV